MRCATPPLLSVRLTLSRCTEIPRVFTNPPFFALSTSASTSARLGLNRVVRHISRSPESRCSDTGTHHALCLLPCLGCFGRPPVIALTLPPYATPLPAWGPCIATARPQRGTSRCRSRNAPASIRTSAAVHTQHRWSRAWRQHPMTPSRAMRGGSLAHTMRSCSQVARGPSISSARLCVQATSAPMARNGPEAPGEVVRRWQGLVRRALRDALRKAAVREPRVGGAARRRVIDKGRHGHRDGTEDEDAIKSRYALVVQRQSKAQKARRSQSASIPRLKKRRRHNQVRRSSRRRPLAGAGSERRNSARASGPASQKSSGVGHAGTVLSGRAFQRAGRPQRRSVGRDGDG